MTETDPRQELAEAFGRDLDPLKEYEAVFNDTGADPFDVYEENRLETRDLSDAAVGEYRRTFREWRAFMDTESRHPACPNEDHVAGFIAYLQDVRGNAVRTVENRLMYLNQAFQYWQEDAAFPHPQDYNPIDLAKATADLDREPSKEPPRLSVDDLRKRIDGIPHVRDRAFVVDQLKLGLRATELCNIKLSEVHIASRDIRDHYDELGTSEHLRGRENAVYIPHDRDGNKSKRPRVLPLDDELRAVLIRYLLIRPDNDEPWLFLSKNRRGQLQKGDINRVWKDHFHPEYAETPDHRGVTSHFGRHYFTTYWRVEKDLNRDLIKYMRGDTAGPASIGERGAIDEYVHTYYEDVEDIYRENIFKLRL